MEQSILIFIQEYIRQPWMDSFWIAITHLGDGGFIWILLSIGLLFFQKTRRVGITAILSLFLGSLMTNVALKQIVARARPYEVIQDLQILIERQSDFSFPSGHTCASFAAAVVMYQCLPRRYGVLCLILAILISFLRLYVGVHYPTDVLVGGVVGYFSAWLAIIIVRKGCHTK